MNCCNSFGQCTQGTDCPARRADQPLVDRINASMPAAAPTPEPAQWPTAKRVVLGLIYIVAVACAAASVGMLIAIGNKLGQLL